VHKKEGWTSPWASTLPLFGTLFDEPDQEARSTDVRSRSGKSANRRADRQNLATKANIEEQTQVVLLELFLIMVVVMPIPESSGIEMKKVSSPK
jgi:hypothetical protein